MTDEPTPEPAADTAVSLSKGGPAGAVAGEAAKLPRPRAVLYIVAAIAVSVIAGLIATIALFGQTSWLVSSIRKSDLKAKPPVHHSTAELMHQASQAQRSGVFSTVLVAVVLIVLAIGVYRGRYWSRWAVVAVWFLSSFTGTVVGINSVLAAGRSIPLAYKVPSFVAGAALIVAVVLVNLRPCVAYFAQTKPVRPDGMPQRRGMFAPREPAATRPGTRTPAATRPTSAFTSSAASRGEAYIRSKSRTGVDPQRSGRPTVTRSAGKSRRSGS